MEKKQYIALAYYLFVPLTDPTQEVEKHKNFFSNTTCVGRIYLSEEGINGQMSGTLVEIEAYTRWLQQDERFSKIQFKAQPVCEPIFPRMTVKYRKQLVAIDLKIQVKEGEGAKHVSAREWKRMLETGEYLVLDVRNQYEWEIGHFEGAVLPHLNTFREFPAFADQLKTKIDPEKTKIMLYCTGGIRCELYSVLLKQKGFSHMYQLEGGVIEYGLKEGSEHWKGKLFVFDDRLAVAIDGQESEPIAACIHCKAKCDTYYNCANMDCNELFICCSSCMQMYQGCCSFTCQQADRVRKIEAHLSNKPFRRKHLIATSAQDPKSDFESDV